MGNTPREKLLGMLGLCIRARRAVCGTVNVCEALKAGKVKLVVAAADNSAATDKRLSDRTAFYGVRLIKTELTPPRSARLRENPSWRQWRSRMIQWQGRLRRRRKKCPRTINNSSK